MEKCPICKTIAKTGDNPSYYECPRCGTFMIERVAKGYSNAETDLTKIAILSHAVRKMQGKTDIPFLNQKTIYQILQNPLPSPFQQVTNFVLWLGDKSVSIGEKVLVDDLRTQSVVGTRLPMGVSAIINHLSEKNYIEQKKLTTTRDEPNQWEIMLKLEGWEYFENIKKGSVFSKKAFMAMKFGDKELDEMLTDCFKPAVKDTGFELFRLDDAPQAGLIDDRLRVEIRTSRFLIADLTHENAGAYWEAGYAEGLGKPVIYTCEKKKFHEKKTHFDTNHHTTILWDSSNLKETAENLKNTIRATLPEEAQLSDLE